METVFMELLYIIISIRSIIIIILNNKIHVNRCKHEKKNKT